jgi:hypothetical protein
MPQLPKDWWTSRSLWFNIVSLLVFAAGWLADSTGLLHLDPQVAVIAGGVVAVGNFALRLLTSAPIAGTPAAAPATPRG